MQESLHLYVVLVLECWKVERCVPGPSLSPGELQHNASFTNQFHLCNCIYYSLPACYPEAVLWLLLLSQSPQVCTLHDFVGALYNCVVNILSPCRLPNHTHRAVWNGTSTSHRPPPFGVPPFWGEVSTVWLTKAKNPHIRSHLGAAQLGAPAAVPRAHLHQETAGISKGCLNSKTLTAATDHLSQHLHQLFCH